MRGRLPVPTELKVIRGTDQPCRRPAAAPDLVGSLPGPPKTFDAEERAEWRKLVQRYRRQNRLIMSSEYNAHVQYVLLTVRLARSEAELAALEQREVAAAGEGATHAEAMAAMPDDAFDRREAVLRRLEKQTLNHTRLAAELGITPSARSRAGFAVPKAPKASPWGKLRGGRDANNG